MASVLFTRGISRKGFLRSDFVTCGFLFRNLEWFCVELCTVLVLQKYMVNISTFLATCYYTVHAQVNLTFQLFQFSSSKLIVLDIEWVMSCIWSRLLIINYVIQTLSVNVKCPCENARAKVEYQTRRLLGHISSIFHVTKIKKLQKK